MYKGSGNATVEFHVAKSSEATFKTARSFGGSTDVSGFGPNAYTAHGGLSVLFDSADVLAVSVSTGGASANEKPSYDVDKAVAVGRVIYPKLVGP